MKSNRAGVISILLAMCVILTACSCAGSRQTDNESDTDIEISQEAEEVTTQASQAFDNTVEWNGKKYTYNRNLTNILFMGIDNSDAIGDETLPGDAGQSDCIMILSLDKETQEGHILQVNRNTMTQVDIYDKTGNRAASIEAQITLQYAYGIGGSSSCYAMKKTVSKLLYGLEIDGYFAINLDGLADINDAIGGVDVYMNEDYTHIDPAFVQGETVHLEGKLAERFIRYRDITEFNSVQNRMERQVDYVTALIDKMKKSSGTKIYNMISPFLDKGIITDLDADQMNALKNYSYATDDVRYLPGEMKMGDKYEEFYISQDEMQGLIIEMFYSEV